MYFPKEVHLEKKKESRYKKCLVLFVYYYIKDINSVIDQTNCTKEKCILLQYYAVFPIYFFERIYYLKSIFPLKEFEQTDLNLILTKCDKTMRKKEKHLPTFKALTSHLRYCYCCSISTISGLKLNSHQQKVSPNILYLAIMLTDCT